MFYRRTNQSNRISKTYDEIYSDQSGAATDWLPFSTGDSLVITIHKASPLAVTNPNPQAIQAYQINPSQGFPNAAIVLESKMGGEADTEAKLIQQWINQSVYYRGSPGGYGFARLRINTINTAQDPEGVVLSLYVDKLIRVRG
jgi:hypothetical protein